MSDMYCSTISYTYKLYILYIMSHITDPDMFRSISMLVEKYIFNSYLHGMENYKKCQNSLKRRAEVAAGVQL
jgi:hypothetical protein